MLRDKIGRIGAHLLQCDTGEVPLRRRRCRRSAGPLGHNRRDRTRGASADGCVAGRHRAIARCDRNLRARHQHRRLLICNSCRCRRRRSRDWRRRTDRFRAGRRGFAARWSIRCWSKVRFAAALRRASALRCARKSPTTSTASPSPRAFSITICQPRSNCRRSASSHMHNPATRDRIWHMKGNGGGWCRYRLTGRDRQRGT